MADKLRSMYRLLGEGDIAGAVQEGDKLIKELREEMGSKRQQITLIENILAPHRGSLPKDGYSSSERSKLVRDAANALAAKGAGILTPKDIEDHLRIEQGIEFGVAHPVSVIGTILSKMQELEKVETGQFRVRANSGEASGLTAD